MSSSKHRDALARAAERGVQPTADLANWAASLDVRPRLLGAERECVVREITQRELELAALRVRLDAIDAEVNDLAHESARFDAALAGLGTAMAFRFPSAQHATERVEPS